MRVGCWIGLCAGGAVGLVAIYGAIRIVTTFYDFPNASQELPAAAAEYRANGMPFVASELMPFPATAADNAAPAILAAIAQMPGKKADHVFEGAIQPGKIAPETAFAPYSKALSLISAVIDRSKVDFARDWDLGPYVLFPEYAEMKTLAKVSAARAARSAAVGNDDAALRDLTLSRQIAVWSGQEPTLISLLVRIACESIALNGLEQCLDAAAQSPARLSRYSKWLAGGPPLPNFGDALRGEAFMGIVTSRNLDVFGGMSALATSSDETDTPKFDPARLRRSGFPPDNKQRAFMTRHIQVWNDAYRTTDGFRQSAAQIGQRLDTIATKLESEKGLSYVLERILLPVFAQAGQAVTGLEARRAVQAGFAEALSTHAKTGMWPKTVAITDPFSGSPLKIKRSGSEFRIYSVGKDGTDDGGRSRRDKGASRKNVDDVAIYPPLTP